MERQNALKSAKLRVKGGYKSRMNHLAPNDHCPAMSWAACCLFPPGEDDTETALEL